MKTLTLIISSLFILMTVHLNAQERGQQHRGPRGHMNPEEMIQKMLEQMKTELQLDEKQEKQVKELFTENFKKRGELMKKYQGQRDSVMFYNKKIEEQQNLSLKKILTEEQYKTYQTNQEKRRQEMEKRRKEGMNHHGQRGRQEQPAVKNWKQDCKGRSCREEHL